MAALARGRNEVASRRLTGRSLPDIVTWPECGDAGESADSHGDPDRCAPSRVWRVLTDFPRYPEWNPFILEVKGVVRQNAVVPYRFEFPRGIRLWANARILRFSPEQELRWTAHFLSPSVFNGEHYFAIAQPSGSQCLFQHGEIFTGVTLQIAWPIIRAYGQQIYGSLNEALKRRAEMSSADGGTLD